RKFAQNVAVVGDNRANRRHLQPGKWGLVNPDAVLRDYANHLRHGNLDTDERGRALWVAMATVAGTNAHIDDTAGIKAPQIRAKRPALKKRTGTGGNRILSLQHPSPLPEAPSRLPGSSGARTNGSCPRAEQVPWFWLMFKAKRSRAIHRPSRTVRDLVGFTYLIVGHNVNYLMQLAVTTICSKALHQI
ncbi:hypothetical protein ACW2AB_02265, partial [Limosilactobacillus fermentum]